MEKTKVLLVDDEKDILDLIGARIKGWGYELITASTGEEALDAVKNQKPDVVVLDYMLPDMDGVFVLSQIRMISHSLAVIMFTAYPEAKAIQGAESLGISAFIPKLSAYADAQAALKTTLEMIDRKTAKGGASEK